MIYIIDDDPAMARCIQKVCATVGKPTQIFSDAVSAMQTITESLELPELIFLDILLTGPDGFTFLNELISYDDTAKIPIVIVSSLNLKNQNLDIYGVVGILNKDTMTPAEVKTYVDEY